MYRSGDKDLFDVHLRNFRDEQHIQTKTLMSDVRIKLLICHSNHHVIRVLLDYLTMRNTYAWAQVVKQQDEKGPFFRGEASTSICVPPFPGIEPIMKK
jgi:hypothetical protein